MSYPFVLGCLVSDLSKGLVTVFLTQYFAFKTWNWNEWKDFRLDTLRNVVSFLISSTVACFVGSAANALSMFYSMDQTSPFLVYFFRSIASNGVIMVCLTPFLMSLRYLRFKSFKKLPKLQTALIALLLLLIPIPLYFLTIIQDASLPFTSIMGLNLCFPIVLLIFTYSNEIVGTFSVLFVSLLSNLFIALYKMDISLIPFDQNLSAVTLFQVVLSGTALILYGIIQERNMVFLTVSFGYLSS